MSHRGPKPAKSTHMNFWYFKLPFAFRGTVIPNKYAHGFVVLCFFVVMQSFKMNSHEVFIHIHQGCFAGTGAIVRLPQCQWSKPDGYGKISQCTTTTKHSKAKTVCIFLGIYCKRLRYVCQITSRPHHSYISNLGHHVCMCSGDSLLPFWLRGYLTSQWLSNFH